MPARTELLAADLAGAPAVERVQLTRVELAPGQAPGEHHHPCDVVGTVLQGVIHYQRRDGDVTTLLVAGDAFFEPRDTLIRRFDNASATEAAVFVAAYLVPPGGAELLVMGPPAA